MEEKTKSPKSPNEGKLKIVSKQINKQTNSGVHENLPVFFREVVVQDLQVGIQPVSFLHLTAATQGGPARSQHTMRPSGFL